VKLAAIPHQGHEFSRARGLYILQSCAPRCGLALTIVLYQGTALSRAEKCREGRPALAADRG
jgi:hypothetical protein